jgi:hypothetical protein
MAAAYARVPLDAAPLTKNRRAREFPSQQVFQRSSSESADRAKTRGVTEAAQQRRDEIGKRQHQTPVGAGASLELINDSCRNLRAHLVRLEKVARDAIHGEPQGHVPVVAVEINACAYHSCNRPLASIRRLRSHEHASNKGVRPDINAFGAHIAKAWPAAEEYQPGVLSRLTAINGENFPVRSHPVPVPVDGRAVHAVHVRADTRHLIKAKEGVSDIDVIAVFLEDSLHALRRRLRRRDRSRK